MGDDFEEFSDFFFAASPNQETKESLDPVADNAADHEQRFQQLDLDKDGILTTDELESFLNFASIHNDSPIAQTLRQELEKNGGKIDINTFKMVCKGLKASSIAEMDAALNGLDTELAEAKAVGVLKKQKSVENFIKLRSPTGKAPEARLILGPIIGKVTESTARILVEANAECVVECCLKKISGGEREEHKLEMKLPAKLPTVFRMTGLTAGTKYTVLFSGKNNKLRQGSFHTFDPKQPSFMVAAASCDKGAGKRGDRNLFDKMYNDYVANDSLDLLVRHGDQVYADEAFFQGEAICEDLSLAPAVQDDLIYQAYREIYLRTFDAPDVRRLHANVQTLMLWDDHELRNDWGSFKQDTDRGCLDYRIARVARLAYWYYQRQLWDDVDFETWAKKVEYDGGHDGGNEGSYHSWGPFGLLLMDGRGCRTFTHRPNDGYPFMSSLQFGAIQQALSPEGEFKDVKSLLVVHSMTFVLMSSKKSIKMAKMPPQVDKMGFGLYPDEQIQLLDAFAKWKKEGAGERELALVCGDMHFGMSTSVYQGSDGEVANPSSVKNFKKFMKREKKQEKKTRYAYSVPAVYYKCHLQQLPS